MNIIININNNNLKDYVCSILLSINPEVTINDISNTSTKQLEQLKKIKHDILILDCSNFEYSHTENTIFKLRQYFISTPVICLFNKLNKNDVNKCIQAGINGCIEKPYCKEYLKSLLTRGLANNYFIPVHVMKHDFKNKSISSNIGIFPGCKLTNRQEEVIEHIKFGKSNKDIGKLLGLSEGTIRTHVTHILNKLNAANRTEAVHIATKMGMIG